MDHDGDYVHHQGVEEKPEKPAREALSQDVQDIGRRITTFFYSQEANTFEKSLPVSDKAPLMQGLALDALLAEVHARVNGHYKYPRRQEHGIRMGYFSAHGEMPTEIRGLLRDAKKSGSRFVVQPDTGEVFGTCKVVDIEDEERNKRRILFVRSGRDRSSLSMDVLDVTTVGEEGDDRMIHASFDGINHNLSLTTVSDKIASFCR